MSEPLTTAATSTIVTHGLLAVFGAVAHAINAHRRGQSKGLMDFFLLTLMSSFSGVVFSLLALHFFDNQYMTLAAAGAGGFLGVEGLAVLAVKIRDALGTVIK